MANIYIETMGCDKNTADSSALKALLQAKGHNITMEIIHADWAILNTCGFILPAKEASIESLLALVGEKEQRPDLKIMAIGCLVQKYMESLKESVPEVDSFFGVYQLEEILDCIDGSKKQQSSCPANPVLSSKEHYPRSEDGATAYLKIADGCDTHCTYCAIPSIKGPYVSRKMDILIEEAKSLADQGVKELILVAQDTTAYGKDIGDGTSLAALLEALAVLKGFHWIRILYAYPDRVDPTLVECISRHPKICNYLDIPFQHGDDKILKKMGRRHGRQELLERLKMIREINPSIAIRSTFIAGFPQEDEEAFEHLLDFLKEAKLQWVGAFTYSREDHTPAAAMTGQIDDVMKQKRYERLMETQQPITRELLQMWVGCKIEVLIEEKIDVRNYMGRAFFMAPDVDGMVTIQSSQLLVPGSFVMVNITDATEYDLIGEFADDDIQ